MQLQTPPPAPRTAPPQSPLVSARVHREAGLTHTISSRDHTWIADEPTSVGGADKGPTPVEQLFGAMGSCTAMTVELYAQRKGWPLGSVDVAVSARSLKHPVTVRTELRADLQPEQFQRLQEIAKRCPVVSAVSGGPDGGGMEVVHEFEMLPLQKG